jgi:hypothetical protein
MLTGYSALFTLYESILSISDLSPAERKEKQQSMEDIAHESYLYAKNCYEDEHRFMLDILSPYLPYSLCQSAIIQHRLWMETNDELFRGRFHVLVDILRNFKKRWLVAGKYIQVLVSLEGKHSSVIVSPAMLV